MGTDEQATAATAQTPRRRAGRGARRDARQATTIVQNPYISRQVPVSNLLSNEAIELLEDNAEQILAEIGLDFKDDAEALALWRDAGAEVDGERVRMPRGLCRKLLETVPESFIQHARNPARSVPIGGNATVFAPVYGPPFVSGLGGERRYATIADFENFVKLAYMSPALHHSGGTICEPVDLPVNKRHLDMIHAHIRLSDKPFMGSVTAPERAADTVAMARLLFGSEFVDQNCVLISLINANSPLTWDGTMLGALKEYARAGQACITSPFILSGAMAPSTVAGTVAQTLAEAMAGMAFTQLVRPGAPAVFGSFAASISMQSGAPTFGTPEPAMVLFACAQLARRLGVPFRSGGSLTGAKSADAQAAYESANTLWPTLMAGSNFVLHAAGWLEGGLVAGYEKFIMDADQLGIHQVMAGGVDMSENGQAMDALREVGPGNHFLGCAHTQANFESAFYRSAVADNNTFEQWQIDGSLDTRDRAAKVVQQRLRNYQQPALDPATAEALNAFIAKAKAAVPDSNV